MDHSKYVCGKSGIANCPFCRGVIFRDFHCEPGGTSFTMRCPHCQKDVRVNIDEQGILIEKQKNESEETI